MYISGFSPARMRCGGHFWRSMSTCVFRHPVSLFLILHMYYLKIRLLKGIEPSALNKIYDQKAHQRFFLKSVNCEAKTNDCNASTKNGLMFLVVHQFGRVEFRNSNICFDFFKCTCLKETTTDIQNSTCPHTTDGVTPNKAFFHWNPELLGLGR